MRNVTRGRREVLHAVLHDQADRRRHRPRSGDLPPAGGRRRWRDPRRYQARHRHDLHGGPTRHGRGGVHRQAGRRGRILIVDDELIVANTLQRALARDHDVTGLIDPREAVRQIENGQAFDVILCDLMMPKVTGMELYETLAVLAPDQASRMIFITGGVFTDKGRAFLDSTGNAYVEKPVDLDMLRALVVSRIRMADAWERA